MKKFVLLILSFLFLPNLSFAKSYGDYQGAVYLSNEDAGKIKFNLPDPHPELGNAINIKVNGIDTPKIQGGCEKENYSAEQAKEMVADILKDAETIILKNLEGEKTFRADVMVDEESLADELIEAGMAVPYDGGTKTHNWCEEQ